MHSSYRRTAWPRLPPVSWFPSTSLPRLTCARSLALLSSQPCPALPLPFVPTVWVTLCFCLLLPASASLPSALAFFLSPPSNQNKNHTTALTRPSYEPKTPPKEPLHSVCAEPSRLLLPTSPRGPCCVRLHPADMRYDLDLGIDLRAFSRHADPTSPCFLSSSEREQSGIAVNNLSCPKHCAGNPNALLTAA